MKFFKKKKPEDKPNTDTEDIKRAVSDEPIAIPDPPKFDIKPPKRSQPESKIPESVPNPEIRLPETKEEFAPLFIKIDKYSSILNTINDLKATVSMAKNAMVVQKEIEKLAEENRKMIEEGFNKINTRLAQIDQEFIKPKGFKKHMKKIKKQPELDSVVNDLKSQVDDLRTELENVS